MGSVESVSGRGGRDVNLCSHPRMLSVGVGSGVIASGGELARFSLALKVSLAREIGMDPVQFGIIMMLNLGLGLSTPPVGTPL